MALCSGAPSSGALCSEAQRLCPNDAGLVNGRDTGLSADPAYLALLEAQSTWPGQYVFGTTVPVNPCNAPLWGGNRKHVGGGQVDGYNSLLAAGQRVQKRAAQHRLETELYGTAPLMLRRASDQAIDAGTRLRWGESVHKEGARVLTEEDFKRRGFVTLPGPLLDLPETRLGRLTRVGPEDALWQPRE